VEAAGFKRLVRDNLVLHIAQIITVDPTLVSGVTEHVTVIAPTADISLYKLTSITEKMRIPLRAEAFNITNTYWFGPAAVQQHHHRFGVRDHE
jgi:hypothetical protein